MKTETDKAIEEFLNAGGVIQKATYRQSGRIDGAPINLWGTKKPAKPIAPNTPAASTNTKKNET